MDVWDVERINPKPSRPEILRSDDGAVRVIALAIRRDEVLNEHQVHEHTWLMVLDGTLQVTCGTDVRAVGRGSILHFDPRERRTVRATTDASILYLLAPWPGPGHPSLTAMTRATDTSSR